MEHKIDEAAVWQRVAGSASRSANESPRPVTIAPVLREIWEEMECCHRLFSQLARSGSRGYAPIQQAQRQQTGQLGALICLLTGNPPTASNGTPPTGSRMQQLIWSLNTMERCATRLEEVSAQAAGMARDTLKELAVQQRQLWSRCLILLGSLVMA